MGYSVCGAPAGMHLCASCLRGARSLAEDNVLRGQPVQWEQELQLSEALGPFSRESLALARSIEESSRARRLFRSGHGAQFSRRPAGVGAPRRSPSAQAAV